MNTDVPVEVAVGVVLPAQRTADTAPAAFAHDVLERLEALEQRSAEHEQALRPENTKKGYGNDWRAWEEFCALLEIPPTAITQGSLAAFVEWCWVQPGRAPGSFMAPASIDRRLSGVVVTGRNEHQLTLDRTVAARARRILKARVKAMEEAGEVRGRGPAPALLVSHLRRVVGAAPDNMMGVRDRALVLLHFAVAGREHELAALRVRDIVETENGLVVDIRVSKTTPRTVKVPFGSRPSTCPVRAWRAWAEAAGIGGQGDTHAFRQLSPRWLTVQDAGLSPEGVGDVITRLGATAGLPFRVTGHSPRRGFATSAKAAGADRKTIARQGGWTPNSRAMEGYFEDADGWEDSPLIGIGL